MTPSIECKTSYIADFFNGLSILIDALNRLFQTDKVYAWGVFVVLTFIVVAAVFLINKQINNYFKLAKRKKEHINNL